MDFITAALPNLMFIAGLIAVGIGLGLEFKIVEIKGELNKTSRLGAIAVGSVLMLVSIYLYTRPPQAAPLAATAAGAPPAAAQANAAAIPAPPTATSAPPTAMPPTAIPAPPTATHVPPTATHVPPTATRVPPTATRVPPTATSVPPTATSVPPTKPPTPTAVPGVKVPDIRGKNLKDAQKILEAASLRLGDKRVRCEDIGAQDDGRKLKKGQVLCQSPAPGSVAAPNTPVLVVLVGGEGGHD
jgi:hypothetical protein